MESLLSSGDVAQISGFLLLLRAKGESFEEVSVTQHYKLIYVVRNSKAYQNFVFALFYTQISGLARAMISRCVPVKGITDAFDIAGTGGDGANTVNISTAACILAAATGAKVAKVWCITCICFPFLGRNTCIFVKDMYKQPQKA